MDFNKVVVLSCINQSIDKNTAISKALMFLGVQESYSVLSKTIDDLVSEKLVTMNAWKYSRSLSGQKYLKDNYEKLQLLMLDLYRNI